MTEEKKRKQFNKKRIFKLFGYKCILCCKAKDDLEIHHHIPFEFSNKNDKENLIVVCHNCHRKVLHKHVSLRFNYGSTRRDFYMTFCMLLGILPVRNKFDYAIFVYKNEETIDNKKIRQLNVLMRWLDYYVGCIDNGYKEKEMGEFEDFILMKNLLYNNQQAFLDNGKNK